MVYCDIFEKTPLKNESSVPFFLQNVAVTHNNSSVFENATISEVLAAFFWFIATFSVFLVYSDVLENVAVGIKEDSPLKNSKFPSIF